MAALVKDKDLIACKKCGAIIKYNLNDIKSVVINKDKQGNEIACNYLLCPGCGDEAYCSRVVHKMNEEN